MNKPPTYQLPDGHVHNQRDLDTKAIEILRVARDSVLTSPAAWIKNVLVKGNRVCAIGAVVSARTIITGNNMTTNAELWASCHLDYAAMEMGYAAVATFPGLNTPRRPAVLLNDSPETTYEDVISMFDRAIKALEEGT